MRDERKFINRELSWIRFNNRVLGEAVRQDTPLLERAKFLSIVSSNLDEFFMVRVGKLERKIDLGRNMPDVAGLTPERQLVEIRAAIRRQVKNQYTVLTTRLLPTLRKEGLVLMDPRALSEEQRYWLSRYFDAQIMPVLTPRMISAAHPVPLLAARRLYIAVLLQSLRGGQPQLSLVPVPGAIDRLVMLPMGEGKARGVLLEDVIGLFLGRLFPHMSVLASTPFRITRNTDFLIDPDSPDGLLEEMRKNIKRRSYGKIVRVELPRKCEKKLAAQLMKSLEADRTIRQRVDGPLDLTFLLKQVYGLPGFDHLKYTPYEARTDERLAAKESIFRTIRGGDLFFYHPYDSFDPIVRFVREAADDENVLAIKQTLYRISRKSPLIPALARAAQKGKQVTVLIEVRARFDEENNIAWCATLEKAGCHVIYGVPEWKTHSKITLVVRREPNGLRNYLHLGTGNYNDSTARMYTDMGILTCDRQLGEDAVAFFNIVTGNQYAFPMQELIASPYAMRRELILRVRREASNARSGLPAAVVVKSNSLSDPEMIRELYQAAEAGVKVSLLIRGICCARLPHNDNMRVMSIVGRFLEHARVFIFENSGNREVFISSADWMPRNLNKRIELMVPVKDPGIAEKIVRIIALELSDNKQSWRLTRSDGYIRGTQAGASPVSAQEVLMSGKLPENLDINRVFRLTYDQADSRAYAR